MSSSDTAAMRVLTAALHERDTYTGEHCERVVKLTAALGLSCGLTGDELSELRIASLFHDVGKIGIPDTVLLKAGPLNPAEWRIMQSHPARGARLCLATQSPLCEAVAPVIRHHHEAFDGSGYPDGLKGDAIPLLARILTIADAYDAMGTSRPYRPAMSHNVIMEILDSEQGVRFDKDILSRFQVVIERDSTLRACHNAILTPFETAFS